MYKVIIPSVLAYMLVGIVVFCLTIKRALYVAAMWHDGWREMKDPLDLLDTSDYGFAVVAGTVWPLFLMVVAVMRTGEWLWDAILSKIVLNSMSKQFEKENQK